MKKLLIVATALVLAGLTQAATVEWKVKGAAASEGQTVYLVLNSDMPAENPPTLDALTGAAFASGAIESLGRGQYGVSGSTDVGNKVAAGATANYTIFFVDTASNSYLNGGTGTVKGYGPNDPPVAATASTANYVAPGGAGWTQVEAVPEPTAVALLALGLAALGLKRKVA